MVPDNRSHASNVAKFLKARKSRLKMEPSSWLIEQPMYSNKKKGNALITIIFILVFSNRVLRVYFKTGDLGAFWGKVKKA